MKLYLMQHGVNLSKDQDPDKALSPEGKVQVETSGAGMKMLGLDFDAMVASPKKRAQQTAEKVASQLGIPMEVVVTDKVKAMADPEESMVFLKCLGKESVLMAGHQPSIGKIVGKLIGAGEEAVQVMNAGLIAVESEDMKPGTGKLLFALTPEQLAMISGQ